MIKLMTGTLVKTPFTQDGWGKTVYYTEQDRLMYCCYVAKDGESEDTFIANPFDGCLPFTKQVELFFIEYVQEGIKKSVILKSSQWEYSLQKELIGRQVRFFLIEEADYLNENMHILVGQIIPGEIKYFEENVIDLLYQYAQESSIGSSLDDAYIFLVNKKYT